MEQVLSPELIIGVVLGYFVVLIGISFLTAKKGDNRTFFIANRNSPWFLVAFGMIGASLSGVTFISIPGAVGGDGVNKAFSYMQVVFGYLLGYLVVATVLLPVYYKLGLTTIYGYLAQRLGFWAHKTGSGFFLLSRIIGASFRLFLVAIVLQMFVMQHYGIPFWITVSMTIVLIWIYTFKGGIQTIVVTDVLQTTCMLAAVVMTIFSIAGEFEMSVSELPGLIANSSYGQMFHFEGGWEDPNNFFKQFFSGALITIVMTGLDQDMMQKNLTCKTLGDSQKNMITLSWILVFVNALFLGLGALLYLYAQREGIAIPERSDQLYPTIALQHLSPVIGLAFVLGLIAAAYSSADSALTALTTSFCVDFLGFEEPENRMTDPRKRRIRYMVHIGFSILLLFVIIAFKAITQAAVINGLFKAAGYTYGPLLGMFAFGLFTKRKVVDRYVLPVCIASPLLSFLLDYNSTVWFSGFTFGFIILAVNGLLTFLGLWAISRPAKSA